MKKSLFYFYLICFTSISFGQYYNVTLDPTGEYQLIIFENSISSLNLGDEIGVFDQNGIQNSGDCSNQIGELLVGAEVYPGSQFDISAIGSLDYCAFGGFQWSGYVEGNPLLIKIYKPDLQMEFIPTITYQAGTGEFGELLISISELTLEGFGCTDPEALNYDPDAIYDDGNCEYPLIIDPPENLVAIGGDGNIALMWDGITATGNRSDVTLWISDVTDDNIEISMINTVAAVNFQFDIIIGENLEAFIISAYGGISETLGYNVVTNTDGLVLGYSLSLTPIPPGEHVLVNVEWAHTGENDFIDLAEGIFPDENPPYNELSINYGAPYCYGDCFDPSDITYNLYRDGNLYDDSIDYTIYDDGGLGYSETHCYTVTATDGLNESDHSNEACATTFSSSCADPEACNYDPNSVIDDNCWYPEDEGWCDCEGNILDCANECGGSAYFDDCGLCDDIPENDNDCMPNPPENLTADGGINNIYLEWQAPGESANREFAYLYISDATDEYLEISMSNDVDVHGVQFEIDANDLQPVFNGIGGGSSEDAGFEAFVNENGLVLGYDIDGGFIPPGNSVLLYVYWDVQGSDAWITLENIIVAAINGEIVNVNPTPPYCYGECTQFFTYNIYRDNLLIVGGIENLFFTDNSVDDIETHEYYVTAYNGYYESLPSNSAFSHITYIDCNGTIDGLAIEDACGYCCDGDTGIECSYWASSIDFGGAYDCYGQCDGSAFNNECGCVEGSTGDDFDFCYGCTDPDATNFDPDALFACNGDNSCCEYPPPDADVDISFGNADYWNDQLEIMISSQVAVHSFSIDFFGTNIIDVFGGLSEDLEFTIDFTDNHVQGGAQESSLAPSLGTLFYFELDNPGYAQFIITNAIFFDEYGQEILTDYFDTFEWTPSGGWGDCEDQGLYTDCDGNCFDDNYLGWQGDGYCDDNSFGINLFCSLWDYDQGDCAGEPLLFLNVDGISENGWFSLENAILSGYSGNQLDVQIGPPLIMGDGGDIPIPGTEALPDWQVYISITNYQDNQLEISINNSVGIAGFQFQLINGFEELILEGGGGGSAGAAGFMISTNNSGLVLGFSLTGSSIDDLDTCDSDQFSDCDNDCYPISDMVYLGDGECNDDSPNLDCSKWWFDDGDCVPYQEVDCAGVPDGLAFENECGCVGGTTGLETDFCYGCTDPDAENYDPDALFECYGDNSCCEYSPPSVDVEITFGNANYSDNTLEILINSFVEVSSFEIDFYGTNILDVFGGLTLEYGYNIDFTSTHVQGEPQGEGNLPASNNALFYLELDNPGFAQIIIALVSFYDENGEELLVNYFDSFEWAQTSECDDQGLYTDCGGNCFGENYLNWHGDGYCDDGAYSINLFCDFWDYDLGDCNGGPLTNLEVDGITDNGWFSIEDPIFSGSPGQPQLTVQIGPPLIIGDGGDITVPETIIYSDWDVFISLTNYENNVLEISMNNSVPIAGFQFQIVTGFENFSLLGASGGSADEVPGFQVTTNNEGTVLAFTFGNGSIDDIDTCDDNQFSDCDDTCFPIENLIYLGDGECNDGTNDLPNLSCTKWWFDDGDCEYWEYDCADVPGGDAFENECGCVEGNTGLDEDYCYGCTDPYAINYDEDATIDDGSCNYESENGIFISNVTDQYIEIFMSNDDDVYGFQFNLVADEILEAEFGYASGGSAGDNGFMQSTNIDGLVLGFSLTGSYIPAGNAVLCYVEWSHADTSGFISIDNTMFAGLGGSQMDFDNGDPFQFGEEGDYIYGCTDPEALNYNPYANYDDDSCIYPTPEWQIIELNEGVNWVSFYIRPTELDMQSILQPLIDDDVLISATDALGNQLYDSEAGWINEIGDMSNIDCYFVHVTTTTSLNVFGLPVILPVDIPLTEGENYIGYPVNIEQNIENVFSDMVELGMLNSVMDDSGNSYFPEVGINTIGNILPGEGYRVMAYGEATLQVCEPGGDCDDAIYGCTDPNALNYNPYATVNDGSCEYCNYGDVNNDGGVDILDVVEILNAILNDIEINECADVNQDGEITIIDIVNMINFVLGNVEPGYSDVVQILYTENTACLDADGNVGALEFVLTHGEEFQLYITAETFMADYVTTGNTTNIILFNPVGTELFISVGDFQIIEMNAYTDEVILEVDLQFGDCIIDSETLGCMDADALNYNPDATINDNSCIYAENYPDWQFTVDDYSYSGSILSIVILNDGSGGSEYDLLAAFNENELRGISNVAYDPDNGSFHFPTIVYSNSDSGEILTFKYFNLDNDQIYILNEHVEFVSGMQIGSIENPFEFTNLYYDCAGEPNGDSYLDLCDICDDNPENDSYYNGVDDFGGGFDCGGQCFGIAYFDDDGYCIAPFDPEADDWSYETDCNDVVEGEAYLDDCGICSGGNTDHEPNICSEEVGEDMICWGQFSGPDFDGCGECFGSDRDEDCMGVCWGDAIEDCAGVCEGEALENECGCVGGDTGIEIDYCYGCTDPEASNYNSEAFIDDGSCDYIFIQELTIQSSMWNNISLNILPLEPAVEDVFDPASTLIVRNDYAQYYIPEYNVNLIGDVEVGEGYEIYLSSENSTDMILAGEQIDPATSIIQLLPLYWNNIAFLPEYPMSVSQIFEGIPILIIKDSNGFYYIPSYNVNTIDVNGGMQPGRGYFVYTDGEDAIEFIYPDDPLVRMELTEPVAELNLMDTDYFQCSPSGRSFPLILTGIEGDYEIGDEIAVFANDIVVGALKISDMNFPKVLTTWRGFAEFDIQIDGWLAGDEFSFQIWDESENTIWEIRSNRSIDTSGNTPFSELILDVIDYSLIPEEFRLQQAYPNPFNAEITIEYALAMDSAVSLTVYDLLGRPVANLVNENQRAGNYSITWQANEFTSGIYFLSMIASEYNSTQRIILLK